MVLKNKANSIRGTLEDLGEYYRGGHHQRNIGPVHTWSLEVVFMIQLPKTT